MSAENGYTIRYGVVIDCPNREQAEISHQCIDSWLKFCSKAIVGGKGIEEDEYGRPGYSYRRGCWCPHNGGKLPDSAIHERDGRVAIPI